MVNEKLKTISKTSKQQILKRTTYIRLVENLEKLENLFSELLVLRGHVICVN